MRATPMCPWRVRLIPSAPAASPSGATAGPHALAAAAIRELWEETGLALGQPGTMTLPGDWAGFSARGLLPDAAALRFVFRAITPPGRTRRFDARFFLADADAVAGDSDDFSAASDELSHLHWLPLAEDARTSICPSSPKSFWPRSHLCSRHQGPLPPVPFFDNSGPVPTFRRIG